MYLGYQSVTYLQNQPYFVNIGIIYVNFLWIISLPQLRLELGILGIRFGGESGIHLLLVHEEVLIRVVALIVLVVVLVVGEDALIRWEDGVAPLTNFLLWRWR